MDRKESQDKPKYTLRGVKDVVCMTGAAQAFQ